MKLDEAKNSTNKQRRRNWWKYGSDAKSLYEAISKVDQVMVVARISKTLAMSFSKKDTVFADALVVFNSDSMINFSIMQSSIHNLWAWRYCTTMKTDLNYTPGNVFETFPFPKIELIEIDIQNAGNEYYDFRKKIMTDFEFGLTKLYNLFHNSQLQLISNEDSAMDIKSFEKKFGKDVLVLRKHLQKIDKLMHYNDLIKYIHHLRILHKEMDNIVLNAYGWNDIDLEHDFYEMDYLPEKDRIRYTIHPSARKEILKRLLQLNHQIYGEEESVSTKSIKLKQNSKSEILYNDLF
jgi:hypothetical protein